MKITLIVLCIALVVCVSSRGLLVEKNSVKADAIGFGKNVTALTRVVETKKGKVAIGQAHASEGIVRSESSSNTGKLHAWETEEGDNTA